MQVTRGNVSGLQRPWTERQTEESSLSTLGQMPALHTILDTEQTLLSESSHWPASPSWGGTSRCLSTRIMAHWSCSVAFLELPWGGWLHGGKAVIHSFIHVWNAMLC